MENNTRPQSTTPNQRADYPSEPLANTPSSTPEAPPVTTNAPSTPIPGAPSTVSAPNIVPPTAVNATPPKTPKSRKNFIIIGAIIMVIIVVGAIIAGVLIANSSSNGKETSEETSGSPSENKASIQNTGRYNDLSGVYWASASHYAKGNRYSERRYTKDEHVLALYDFPITKESFSPSYGLTGHNRFDEDNIAIDIGYYDINDKVQRTDNEKLYELAPTDIFIGYDAWKNKFGQNSAPLSDDVAFFNYNGYSVIKIEPKDFKYMMGQKFQIWHGVAQVKPGSGYYANVDFVSYVTIDHDLATWVTVVSFLKEDHQGYKNSKESSNYPTYSVVDIDELRATAEKITSTYRMVVFDSHDEQMEAINQIHQINESKYTQLTT